MAFIDAHGDVLSKQFDENYVTIHCRMPQKYLGRITDPEVTITERKTRVVADSVSNSDDAKIEDVA